MKINRFFVLMILLNAVVLIILLLFPYARLANADLGNFGIPVRCYDPAGIQLGSTVTLTCQGADGTGFIGGQNVPSGYYLMVSDILINGYSTKVSVNDTLGNGTVVYSLTLQGGYTYNDSHLYNFNVPYLILPAGHRLDVVSIDGSVNQSTSVRISGLLVTNLTYIPLVVR